jgi:arylformamidase
VHVSRTIIDLSHPITDGMTTYPGLPGPVISTHLGRDETAARMAEGVSFHIGRIDMVANTGTYVDAPAHFHADGADVAGLAADRLFDVPAVVVDSGDAVAVGPELFPESSTLIDAAVLVRTGWSRHWGTPAYGVGSPFLTRSCVEMLVDARPALVGIDALNVDDVDDVSRPAHHLLLGAGIPIVEHLTGLERLPSTGARFTALPAPVVGLGTMPVRAIARSPVHDGARGRCLPARRSMPITVLP